MKDTTIMLQDFWTLTVDVWQTGVSGFDLGRLITAAGIFLIFLIFRRLFTHFILSSLKELTKKTDTNFDDNAIKAIENPIRFIPIVMGLFFVVEYLEIHGETG